jgi:hypothetical protein
MFKQTLRRPLSGRLGTSEEIREIVGVKACGDLTKLVILVSGATSSCGD